MPAVDTWLNPCCVSSLECVTVPCCNGMLAVQPTMISFFQGLLQPMLWHPFLAWLPHIAMHDCLRLYSMALAKFTQGVPYSQHDCHCDAICFMQKQPTTTDPTVLSAMARLTCCPHMQWHELSSAQAMLSMLVQGQACCCSPQY